MATPDLPGTTMTDPRIVLRLSGNHDDDPIVEHSGQPADYVHNDGSVWTWRGRVRVIGGVRDSGKVFGGVHLRAYDLVVPTHPT